MDWEIEGSGPIDRSNLAVILGKGGQGLKLIDDMRDFVTDSGTNNSGGNESILMWFGEWVDPITATQDEIEDYWNIKVEDGCYRILPFDGSDRYVRVWGDVIFFRTDNGWTIPIDRMIARLLMEHASAMP